MAVPPIPTPDDRWTEGDFEIVSSDNVALRIPSYYLLANR
jgi:hypothetical protein